MKPRILSLIMALCLVFTATATASALSPHTSAFNDEHSSQATKTTLRYPFVKMIMPATSNLYQINMGYLSSFGFGGSNFASYIGYAVFVKFMVVDGNITMKPVNQESILLHPGDNITVLFGTYHGFLWSSNGGDSLDKGRLIGRFLGVTIEKFL